MPDSQTSTLSRNIADFLKRTDHYTEEWRSIGKERQLTLDVVSPSTASSARNYGAAASSLEGGTGSSYRPPPPPGGFRASSVARATSVARQFETSRWGGEDGRRIRMIHYSCLKLISLWPICSIYSCVRGC